MGVVKEEKVLLPSIKSSIDKFGGNADLVQMLDANEENKEDEKKRKMKSSKRMKKVSSKSRHSHHQKGKHHKKRSIDLTKNGSKHKKISGTSESAKKLLKESKEKIGLFARRHLVKALNKRQFDK